MHLALKTPDRVSELIIVDIAPVHYDLQQRRREQQQSQGDGFDKAADPSTAVNAMRNIDLTTLRSKREIDKALENQGIGNERVRGFLMTNLIPDENRGGFYKWRCNITAIAQAYPSLQNFPAGEDVDEQGRGLKYEGRCYFIRGERSRFVTEEGIKEIERMFPRGRVVTVKDAGHWLQADKPNEFIQAVNGFLPETAAMAS